MKKRVFIISAFVITFLLGFGFNSIITSHDNQSNKIIKVTGIGGIFFKCNDPAKMREWYSLHLGIAAGQYGTKFEWRQGADSSKYGCTQWSLFSDKTKYFEPSTKEFMINYRVENLVGLVENLKKEGVTFIDTLESSEYGKFIHIMDIERNKIELWEPVNADYNKIVTGRTKYK